MKSHRYFLTIAGPLLCAAFSQTAAAAVNLTCDRVDDEEATLWVRYVDTGMRRTFDASIKLPPAASQGLQNRTWSLSIDQQPIGQVTLQPRGNGRQSSSLSFDSYASDELASPGATAFPTSWPAAVAAGSIVRAGDLTCQLTG